MTLTSIPPVAAHDAVAAPSFVPLAGSTTGDPRTPSSGRGPARQTAKAEQPLRI